MKLFQNYKDLPIWRKSLILAGAMCLSVSLISVFSLASFHSTISAFNSVSVAVWAVDTESTAADSLTINCNEGGITTAEYNFEVRNYKGDAVCEVDTGYSITISLPKALPEGAAIQLNGESGTVSLDKCSYSFSNAEWFFTAGVKDQDLHIITISADPEMIQSDFIFENIKIHIHTKQLN